MSVTPELDAESVGALGTGKEWGGLSRKLWGQTQEDSFFNTAQALRAASVVAISSIVTGK